MAILEQEQRRCKAFVGWHRNAREKDFALRKAVLVFQTRMGQMPGKLRFCCTWPYWIIGAENHMFQLGILASEVFTTKSEWVSIETLPGTYATKLVSCRKRHGRIIRALIIEAQLYYSVTVTLYLTVTEERKKKLIETLLRGFDACTNFESKNTRHHNGTYANEP